MSGYTPPFPGSGPSSTEGSVPDPGATAGTTRFLREDATWAVTGAMQPGPTPPAPGPALNQWACNLAGFLTYEVLRAATKAAVDALPLTWLGDVVGGIVVGVLTTLLPEEAFLDGTLNTVIFNWVSSHVQTYLSDFAAQLLDDVVWAKFHCQIYDAVQALPGDLATALDTAATAIAALTGYPVGFLAGIEYLLENLGITSIVGLPLSAFSRQYDCSSCAITGVGPTAPIQQQNFDLIVTDGTHREAYIDTIDIPGATVSASGSVATITLPSAGVSAVNAAAPVTSTGGSSPTIGLTTPLATQYGGLGIDSSAFSKGTILANSGSGWLGDAPASDGLVLTSQAAQPGGVSWAVPGSVSAAGPWYTVIFPPTLSHWTQVNPGSATFADVVGGVAIDTIAEAQNMRILARAATVPYDLLVGLVPFALGGAGNPAYGLILRDSASGHLIRLAHYDNAAVSNNTQIGTFSAPNVGVANAFLSTVITGFTTYCWPPVWMRIHNDGTHRTYWYSRDGSRWVQFYSENSGTYITENQVGFFADSGGCGYPVGVTCISWSGP